MNFPAPRSVKELAALIGARQIIGNEANHAKGINELNRAETGDVVFVDHPKYYKKSVESPAAIIIINAETDFPAGKTLLITENPFDAYCRIVEKFQPAIADSERINTTDIGEGSFISPSAFIGSNVRIGKNCHIGPNVSVMPHAIIGDRVVIQAGTVISSDAFYYNGKKDRELWYKKMPSCGRTIIEDDAEVGANCTIDRGVTHDTVIGRGSKLDNLIHIGHDTTLGANCLIAAQVVIAGMVKIGNGVTIWGQVAINKTLNIGDNVTILGKSGVGDDLAPGKVYFGAPAEEARTKQREIFWIKRIPEIWEKLNAKK